MSDLSQRIQNRTPARPPVLDRHDAQRVEARLLTYEQARYETAARLRIENALLREQNERLAADNAALAERNDELWAENVRLRGATTTMGQTIETLGARAFAERERRENAERWHTVYLAGLVIVTAIAVWMAWAAWR